jgi:hypothetical protein
MDQALKRVWAWRETHGIEEIPRKEMAATQSAAGRHRKMMVMMMMMMMSSATLLWCT